jgi:hypothetical protein
LEKEDESVKELALEDPEQNIEYGEFDPTLDYRFVLASTLDTREVEEMNKEIKLKTSLSSHFIPI